MNAPGSAPALLSRNIVPSPRLVLRRYHFDVTGVQGIRTLGGGAGVPGRGRAGNPRRSRGLGAAPGTGSPPPVGVEFARESALGRAERAGLPDHRHGAARGGLLAALDPDPAPL